MYTSMSVLLQVPLLAMLEEYNAVRKEKEEDNQRQKVGSIFNNVPSSSQDRQKNAYF